jgi:hypothetical protein
MGKLNRSSFTLVELYKLVEQQTKCIEAHNKFVEMHSARLAEQIREFNLQEFGHGSAQLGVMTVVK